jgi:hypothetical protein
MDQPTARASLGVLLEALGALRVPDVMDRFLFDREEWHGCSSIVMARASSRASVVPTGRSPNRGL